MKAVRYWPGPESPDGNHTQSWDVYDGKITLKYLSQKAENDFIFREFELYHDDKDGKVG